MPERALDHARKLKEAMESATPTSDTEENKVARTSVDRLDEQIYVDGQYWIDDDNTIHLKVNGSDAEMVIKPDRRGELTLQATLLHTLCSAQFGRVTNGEVAKTVYGITHGPKLSESLPENIRTLYNDLKRHMRKAGIDTKLLSVPHCPKKDLIKFMNEVGQIHIKTKH